MKRFLHNTDDELYGVIKFVLNLYYNNSNTCSIIMIDIISDKSVSIL